MIKQLPLKEKTERTSINMLSTKKIFLTFCLFLSPSLTSYAAWGSKMAKTLIESTPNQEDDLLYLIALSSCLGCFFVGGCLFVYRNRAIISKHY